MGFLTRVRVMKYRPRLNIIKTFGSSELGFIPFLYPIGNKDNRKHEMIQILATKHLD